MFLLRLQSWPELFPTLHQMLETQRDECVDGSFSTFAKLCEDCQDQLDSEEMEGDLNILIQVSITDSDSGVDFWQGRTFCSNVNRIDDL